MFVTVYLTKKNGRPFGATYETKSLTPMHAEIRRQYPGAETYEDPSRVITDFIAGINLGIMPMVRGGRLID